MGAQSEGAWFEAALDDVEQAHNTRVDDREGRSRVDFYPQATAIDQSIAEHGLLNRKGL